MDREHIRREHNVSLLMYHFVCPAKYRRDIFTKEVEDSLVDICRDLEKRYEIQFDEIWADNDHVHFLIQSVPMMSPKRIIQIVKSITAIHLFKRHPEIKRKLRWWQLWTKWYYVNTVWLYWWYDTIKNYVSSQGNVNSKKVYSSRFSKQDQSWWLFEWMVF